MNKRSNEAKGSSPDPTATPPAGATPNASEREGKAPDVGDRIGHELRAMFADVVAEPVPEKFRSLLDELERKSRKSES